MKPALFLFPLSIGLAYTAYSQLATPKAAPSLPLRTVVVAGGPVDYNQYALEANARYVEKLTERAKWRRFYFADGNKASRTISTLVPASDARERALLSWITEEDISADQEVLRASTLKRIDGSSTKTRVLKGIDALTQSLRGGEHGLVYFTGHGSEGQKPILFGLKKVPDTQNTTYALWKGDLAVKELAPRLQKLSPNIPLVLVMVQCHSGGFANVLFKNGDPTQPIWNADFCGFFAATGDRQSSGCTSEVDERDYQDFTTHFFAALSGVTRDGRRVSNADYDRNGAVSLSEAFAYANINDLSIDVPVSTSDAFLRHAFKQETDSSLTEEWTKTPYSQILGAASPWQKAMLNTLSGKLHLTGESRIAQAIKLKEGAKKPAEQEKLYGSQINQKELWKRYELVTKQLYNEFPGLDSRTGSRKYQRAEAGALKWLKKHPAEVSYLYKAYQSYYDTAENASAQEAFIDRFLRATHTVALQMRLKDEGSDQQKAIFNRIRKSESRNPLR